MDAPLRSLSVRDILSLGRTSRDESVIRLPALCIALTLGLAALIYYFAVDIVVTAVRMSMDVSLDEVRTHYLFRTLLPQSMHLCMINAVVIIAKRVYPAPVRALLAIRSTTTETLILCLSLGICLAFALSKAAAWLGVDFADSRRALIISSEDGKLTYALVSIALAPILEELVWRGYFYGALGARYGVFIASAIITALFAVLHVPWADAGEQVWLILCLHLASAGTITAARVLTGSVWPAVAMHIGRNLPAAMLAISQALS